MEEIRGAPALEDLDPEKLASQRLRERRFKSVAVKLADGKKWHVAGPPLGNDGAAEAYRAAMLKMDQSMVELAKLEEEKKGRPSAALDLQESTYEAAYAVLRQSYDLTYEQFGMIADSEFAQFIVQVSLNGELPPTEDEQEEKARDLAIVTERVAWALDDTAKDPGVSLAQKVAGVVVNGIPAEPTEQEPAGNDSPPSESA